MAAALDSILYGHSNIDDIDNDLYNVLGVQPHHSIDIIHREFRYRIRQCHPDRVSDSAVASEQYTQLRRAIEVLGDESMRLKYDTWRSSGLCISFKEYIAMGTSVHASRHWGLTMEQRICEHAITDGDVLKTPNIPNDNDDNYVFVRRNASDKKRSNAFQNYKI